MFYGTFLSGEGGMGVLQLFQNSPCLLEML